MAKNETVSVPADTWTQLTDGDVSSITFQVLGGEGVRVVAQNGAASDPSNAEDVIYYPPAHGERNVSLSDLFPGVTDPNRVYAYAPDAALVFVSHA